MYLIIKPVKMEEDFIDIHIYKIDFMDSPVYHRVFETEQEFYILRDESSIEYYFVYKFKFCDKDKFEQLSIPMEFNHIIFEFWYSTKEIRIIK